MSLCWICKSRPAEPNSRRPATAIDVGVCPPCHDTITARYADAWHRLEIYLRQGWPEIVRRGQFDLTKAFPQDPAGDAVRAQLHFASALGGRLAADAVDAPLESIASALLTGKPHAEIQLLVADCTVPAGRLLSYDSGVSVLRDGSTVLSALWTHLAHPIAVKVCFMRDKAPVRPPPDSHPWHPSKQRKIVKISPYKGDVTPIVARRDLRI